MDIGRNKVVQMKNTVFLLDSGHGGMIDGLYQTDPYIGKYHRFSNGEVAYEGVINRLIKKKVMDLLTTAGIRSVDICPSELDLSLKLRVQYANLLVHDYRDCVLISLHSNAGGGRGFEIYTTPGRTKSDEYAIVFAREFSNAFPEIPVRADYADGDVDKENQFYILRHVACPAILPEFLFYDNLQDWNLLKNPDIQRRYAEMILKFVQAVTI